MDLLAALTGVLATRCDSALGHSVCIHSSPGDDRVVVFSDGGERSRRITRRRLRPEHEIITGDFYSSYEKN